MRLAILVTLALASVAIANSAMAEAHKVPSEDECASNVLCYECDSCRDPNCADPFPFFLDPMDPPPQQQQQLQTPAPPPPPAQPPVLPASAGDSSPGANQTNATRPVDTSPGALVCNTPHSGASNQTHQFRIPPVALCYGCCVKITSKMPDGSPFVKRTCVSNLQINYFMVGLVCMKESGDRGKMCFCETNYCNSQPGRLIRQASARHLSLWLALVALLNNLANRAQMGWFSHRLLA